MRLRRPRQEGPDPLDDLRVRRAVRLVEAGGSKRRLRALADEYGVPAEELVARSEAARERVRPERLRRQLANPGGLTPESLAAAEGFADEADLYRYLAEERRRHRST